VGLRTDAAGGQRNEELRVHLEALTVDIELPIRILDAGGYTVEARASM